MINLRCAPKRDLSFNQKDYFYDDLMNIVRNLGEREIVVVAEDFKGCSRSNPEDYKVKVMKVMVMRLGTRKRKGFSSFMQL